MGRRDRGQYQNGLLHILKERWSERSERSLSFIKKYLEVSPELQKLIELTTTTKERLDKTAEFRRLSSQQESKSNSN